MIGRGGLWPALDPPGQLQAELAGETLAARFRCAGAHRGRTAGHRLRPICAASLAFYGDSHGLKIFRKHLGWYVETAPIAR